MTLLVNGENKDFDLNPLTIKSLLEQLNVPVDYTAVEVNKEIIPRVKFESHELNSGDQVEVVRFVGGGKK